MKLIDAHTHIMERIAGFGPRGELRAIGKGRARWANGDEMQLIPEELGDREFTAESLIAVLDRFGVAKALLLQGSFYGFQNEYACETAARYPDRLLAAGTFDPFCQAYESVMDRLLNRLKLRVIKFEVSSGAGLLGYHRPFAIDGAEFGPVFAELAGRGATLVLDIGSPGMASFQVAAVARVAKRYPALKIVLCHLLAPTLKDTAALMESLPVLKMDNVWFDLAALPANVSPEKYPYPTAQNFLKAARRIVGAQKLIWGTDLPSVLVRESYDNLFRYITETAIFSESELEAVFYDNAMAAYPF